jgi:hypothetical protein
MVLSSLVVAVYAEIVTPIISMAKSTPAYLLNSDGSLRDRPAIKTVTTNLIHPGGSVEITTDGPVDV